MDANDTTHDGRTDAPNSTRADAAPQNGTAPEGEKAIASAEDFAVKRDEKGDLLAVTERIPGSEKYVKVVPISNGKAERVLPSDGTITSLDDDAMLELVREHVEEPDLSHVRDTEDLLAFGLDPLIMAIMNASGFDAAMGMMGENSELAGLAAEIEGNSSGGN